MGNNTLEVCKIQAIGSEVVGQFITSSSKPEPVIFCEFLFPNKDRILSSYSMLAVNSSSVQLYCLKTGQKLKESVLSVHQFTSCVYLPSSKHGSILVVSDSAGILHTLEVPSLKTLANIASNTSLADLTDQKEEISCSAKIKPEAALTAHDNGSVKAWDMSTFSIFNTWTDERVPKAVAFSEAHRLIVVGYEHSCEGIDIRANPIKLFHLLNKDNLSRQLESFDGTCLDISVIDKDNFVIALSSYSVVYVYDIITTALLLVFDLQIISRATRLIATELKEHNTLVMIGTLEGEVLVGKLSLSDIQIQLSWFPLKVVRVFNQENVTRIDYSTEMDSLMVGSQRGLVHIVPNIVSMVLKDEIATSSGQKPVDNFTDSDDSESEFFEEKYDKLRKKYPEKTEEELAQIMKESEEEEEKNN